MEDTITIHKLERADKRVAEHTDPYVRVDALRAASQFGVDALGCPPRGHSLHAG